MLQKNVICSCTIRKGKFVKKEHAGEFDRDYQRLFTLILFMKSAACISSNEGLKI
jgi:hypothetical protein